MWKPLTSASCEGGWVFNEHRPYFLQARGGERLRKHVLCLNTFILPPLCGLEVEDLLPDHVDAIPHDRQLIPSPAEVTVEDVDSAQVIRNIPNMSDLLRHEGIPCSRQGVVLLFVAARWSPWEGPRRRPLGLVSPGAGLAPHRRPQRRRHRSPR